MAVCSFSIEAKKSTIFCCLLLGAVCAVGEAVCRLVNELNGFVGSGRPAISLSPRRVELDWIDFVSAGLVLGAAALEAEGVLNDFPLSFPSRYCFLLLSKSGSFKYSSNAAVNPVGAYRLAS